MGLRKYQKETLEVIEQMESQYGNFSTVVNIPTGGGKTAIAIEFCKNVLNKKNTNRVLWLADRVGTDVPTIFLFFEILLELCRTSIGEHCHVCLQQGLYWTKCDNSM